MFLGPRVLLIHINQTEDISHILENWVHEGVPATIYDIQSLKPAEKFFIQYLVKKLETTGTLWDVREGGCQKLSWMEDFVQGRIYEGGRTGPNPLQKAENK